MPSHEYFVVSPTDSGLSYVCCGRLFNLRVESHGDHQHCDMSVHLVEASVALGGGRHLSTMKLRNFGACCFRLPVSDDDYTVNDLIGFVMSDDFRGFASGPLDDLAGTVEPERFGMLAD